MFLTKLRIAEAMLVTMALVATGAGVIAFQSLAAMVGSMSSSPRAQASRATCA